MGTTPARQGQRLFERVAPADLHAIRRNAGDRRRHQGIVQPQQGIVQSRWVRREASALGSRDRMGVAVAPRTGSRHRLTLEREKNISFWLRWESSGIRIDYLLSTLTH